MSVRKEIGCIVNKILQLSHGPSDESRFRDHLEKYYNDNLNNEEQMKAVATTFENGHSIYYNKTSQIYYNYDGTDYILLNDDSILHLVLEYITTNTQIDTSHKNTLKNKLVKQIKDNNIYEVIPDSETIQKILGYLNHTLFANKSYSKIFLILIGSIIVKKKTENKNLIFTKPNLKSFLFEMNQAISIYFCNTNLFNYFKFKYTQDHENSGITKYVLPCNNINCKIMKTDNQLYVNMAIVGIYYFNRYKSIEEYLDTEKIPTSIISSILYFKEQDKDNTISRFTNTYIIKESDQYITQKELIFLWKRFIYDNELFVNIFPNYNDFLLNLFSHLKVDFEVCSNNNILNGFYSLESPYLECFRLFWSDNFKHCTDESDLELTEILFIYNKFSKVRKNFLSETMINIIIQCFFPEIEVVENKKIHHLKCSLWDKKKEIDTFLKTSGSSTSDNINNMYKKYISTKTDYRISKIYFQKYINTLVDIQT